MWATRASSIFSLPWESPDVPFLKGRDLHPERNETVNRRAPDAPGPAVPYMSDNCGHDAGITGGPVCQNRAAVHLFAGQAPDKPSDWAMSACPDHLEQAMLIAFDWHDVSPACHVPDATWQFGSHQGEGFCFWPEAEAIMREELAKAPKLAAS